MPPTATGPMVSLDDVYYTLFRHKWKILLCSVLGFAAAGIAFVYKKPSYVSNAKLLIRYVAVEGLNTRSSIDNTVTKSPDMRGETIINAEQNIITSIDLIKQVAQNVGPEKVLAKQGGGNEVNAAANAIILGLTCDAPRFSSVISLTFRHPDPEIVQPVLRELIALYFKKHVEVHRSSGLVGDFLSQETDQLRTRLAQTEEELRKAKAKAGVVSLEDAKKSFSDQMAKLREQLFTTQAELAERQSLVKELIRLNSPQESAAPATSTSASSGKPAAKDAANQAQAETAVPASARDEYRIVLSRLEFLRKREQEMLIQYTPENPRVREVTLQIAETQASKLKIEAAYPSIIRDKIAMSAAASGGSTRDSRMSQADLTLEISKISGLEAKLKALEQQIQGLRSEVTSLESLEGTIQELMRKKELEESSYRRYATSLEQSRINEAMGSGQVSNISQIQSPSAPALDLKQSMQLPIWLGFGGVFIGLAWAVLIEFVLDRSLRRPSDIEKKLRIPLFITIPSLGRKRWPWRGAPKVEPPRTPQSPALGEPQVQDPAKEPIAALSLIPADSQDVLRSFHDTLRDRLIGYFENQGMTHKPKLVAVTGLGRGSGVTTTAAGLARSLSETGEGNVLLVDLTPGSGSAHQFVKGKVACGLDELLTKRDQAQVDNNLYVVAQSQNSEQLPHHLPHRFRHLVPKLKASDFDYIIFDMPPVSQISITPRLASYMDMVLLVAEAEKTDLDLAQRATELLAESKTHLGVVLNKGNMYLPSRLHREYLGST